MNNISVGQTKIREYGLKEKLDISMSKLGLTYLSHAIIFPQGDCSTLFSNESWGDCYSQNKLSSFDPCVRYLFNTNKAMVPWENMMRDWKKIDVMEERKKVCSLQGGISVYSRLDNGIKTITALGTDNKNQIDLLLLRTPSFEIVDFLSDLYNVHMGIIEKSRC